MSTTWSWGELIVTDSDGDIWGDLRGVVHRAPANLDNAVIRDGKITEWPGFFIAAPEEEPGSDTPRGKVDWSGFETALRESRSG